jgi:hypothetical protein
LWRILISMQFWQFVVLQIIHSNSIIYDSFTYCWPWLLICHKSKIKHKSTCGNVLSLSCQTSGLICILKRKSSTIPIPLHSLLIFGIQKRESCIVKSETLVSACHFEAWAKCLKWAWQWEKICFWGCFYCFTYIP